EAAIDLQRVERRRRERVERRVARAEIIDDQRDAERLQVLEARLRFVAAAAEDRLGDLESQFLRQQPAAPYKAVERRDQVAIGELALVHIDAGDKPGMRRIALLPAQQIAAGLLEHPPVERDDEPGLLGDGEEVVRQQQAAIRVLPAHQRLAAL